MNPKVRYPAVAEAFYPADALELDRLVAAMLHEQDPPSLSGRKVRALMVPHAGYRYSGRIAAAGYRTLGSLPPLGTAILMGNAHTYLFDGIALDSHESWHSPLGNVPVDAKMNKALLAKAPDLVHELDIAHHSDHILEVQLPFLQRALKSGFSILPLLFGDNSPGVHERAADLLLAVLGKDDLIVVSTDLSHYPCFQDANLIDSSTIEHVVGKDLKALELQEHRLRTMASGELSLYCSPDALKTLLVIANRLGWHAEKLCYCNSGDDPHDDKRAVVGYGTVIFYES
jgi:AmmeMemoRadiSam system protein B